jgi:perosamine synthetase
MYDLTQPWPTSSANSAANMAGALMSVVKSGIFTEGPMVDDLEDQFRDYLISLGAPDTTQVVALNSGTAALSAALLAAGVEAGDEVIVPSMSFTASALAVTNIGARPVFVDVDETWSIDVERVERAVGRETAAIMGVDLHGMPADWDGLRAVASRYGLLLIEDACPAYGAMYKGRPAGTLGDAAAFSVNQSKMLSAGEGGFYVTERGEWAVEVRRLRRFGEPLVYGKGEHRASRSAGWNWKMSEFTAAVAHVSLTELPITVARGRRNVEIIREAVRGCGLLSPPFTTEGADPSFHKYRVRLAPGISREDAEKLLVRAGVPHAPVDVLPLPEHPAFRGCPSWGGHVRATQAIERTVVLGTRTQPIFGITTDEAERWAEAIGSLREAAII